MGAAVNFFDPRNPARSLIDLLDRWPTQDFTLR